MADKWDVIPDIHADIARLDASLGAIDPNSGIAFLGDFIDAGKATRACDDAAVLHRVRSLIDDRRAVAVMGNHELNAILYHSECACGGPLREHSEKNRIQHRSFLEAFGTATQEARDWTQWFLTLPLWLDIGGLRLVHACWNQAAIDIVAERRPDGLLAREDLAEISAEKSDFARAVKTILTGPEVRIEPHDHPGFQDGGGHWREHVRIAWWRAHAQTWREAALSVPDPKQLPDGDVPSGGEVAFYPDDAPPVLIGHYKMTGEPDIESPKAACLDYPEAPCIYRWRGEDKLERSRLHQIAKTRTARRA